MGCVRTQIPFLQLAIILVYVASGFAQTLPPYVDPSMDYRCTGQEPSQNLVLMKQTLSGYDDALCADGSPAIVYSDYATKDTGDMARRKWLIHLQGGDGVSKDALFTPFEARAMAQAYASGTVHEDAQQFISSTVWPESLEPYYLLSSDVGANPCFYCFTHVFVPYCTMDMHLGNRGRSKESGGLFFHGSKNIQAIFDLLHAELESADLVVLSGSSVGGIGVMMHIEYLQNQLPTVPVIGIADSSWFDDFPLYDPKSFSQDSVDFYDSSLYGNPRYAGNAVTVSFLTGVATWNATLAPWCDQLPRMLKGLCLKASIVNRFLEVPIFFVVPTFDFTFVIAQIWGYEDPYTLYELQSEATYAYYQTHGGARRQSIHDTLLDRIHAVFAPACVQHIFLKPIVDVELSYEEMEDVVLSLEGQTLNDAFSTLVDNSTLSDALCTWAANPYLRFSDEDPSPPPTSRINDVIQTFSDGPPFGFQQQNSRSLQEESNTRSRDSGTRRDNLALDDLLSSESLSLTDTTATIVKQIANAVPAAIEADNVARATESLLRAEDKSYDSVQSLHEEAEARHDHVRGGLKNRREGTVRHNYGSGGVAEGQGEAGMEHEAALYEALGDLQERRISTASGVSGQTGNRKPLQIQLTEEQLELLQGMGANVEGPTRHQWIDWCHTALCNPTCPFSPTVRYYLDIDYKEEFSDSALVLSIALCTCAVVGVTAFYVILRVRGRMLDSEIRASQTCAQTMGLRDSPVAHAATITLYRVHYWPQEREGQPHGKAILNGVTAHFDAGKLTAIMGGSGCGKTTLLDVFMLRRKTGVMRGRALINGVPTSDKVLQKWMAKSAAYVPQFDFHIPDLTVRQALTYAAFLRLPRTMPIQKKLLRVEHVIDELALRACAGRRIGGSQGTAISGGQKRRLSVAMELLTLPTLVFLDEPTSGLDSATSLDLIQSLTNLCHAGRTIVLTIHQPRPEIYFAFDTVLLMKLGRVVFFGSPKDSVTFFGEIMCRAYPEESKASVVEAMNQNPADKIIDLINANTPAVAELVDTLYADEGHAAREEHIVRAVAASGSSSADTAVPALAVGTPGSPHSPHSPHTPHTLSACSGAAASWLQLTDDPSNTSNTFTDIDQGPTLLEAVTVLVAREACGQSWLGSIFPFYLVVAAMLVLSLTYLWQDVTTLGSMYNVLAALSLMTFSVPMTLDTSFTCPSVIRLKERFDVERQNGGCRSSWFLTFVFVRDVFVSTLSTILMVAPGYWLIRVSQDATRFWLTLSVMVVGNASFVAVSSTLCMTLGMAGWSLSTLYLAFEGLFSGFFISVGSLPVYFRYWCPYLSAAYYLLSSSAFLSLYGLVLPCDTEIEGPVVCNKKTGTAFLYGFDFDDVDVAAHTWILFAWPAVCRLVCVYVVAVLEERNTLLIDDASPPPSRTPAQRDHPNADSADRANPSTRTALGTAHATPVGFGSRTRALSPAAYNARAPQQEKAKHRHLYEPVPVSQQHQPPSLTSLPGSRSLPHLEAEMRAADFLLDEALKSPTEISI